MSSIFSSERIYHLYENMNIEDEKQFLLECPAYTNLPSLLTCQNYSELRMLLTKLFEHRNTILKQTKLMYFFGSHRPNFDLSECC